MNDRGCGKSERPVVGVGAVVFRADQVLLVRRAKPPRQGEWSLPGGSQERGETVFAAAEREVREETGVDIRVLGLVDVIDFIDREGADAAIRFHYTLVDVFAEWIGGDGEPADDALEVTWAPYDRIARFGMWSETERVIALARRLWQNANGS